MGAALSCGGQRKGEAMEEGRDPPYGRQRCGIKGDYAGLGRDQVGLYGIMGGYGGLKPDYMGLRGIMGV